ncbi:MAG TPA: alpha/beta hydrolase [Ktedonobacteraceae bacterium]|nr:alpha/beta hydrolase [Ktedonobacteraceae bacterium]
MDQSGKSSTLRPSCGMFTGLIFLLVLVSCGGKSQSNLTIVKQPASLFSPLQYQVNWQRNVNYGPLPQERLDICRPAEAATRRPGVVLIHGGGWMLGDKQTDTSLCKNLASLGFVVLNIDYRLATKNLQPQLIWPAQLVDAQLAVRWMRAHASQLDLDSSHICSDGDSAGGQLAVFLGVLATIHPGNEASSYANQSPKVSCVVDNFGPVDLVNPRLSAPLSVYFSVFGKATQQSDPAIYRDASPIFDVTPQSAPMLIVQGAQDMLVLPAQSRELQQALLRNHVPVQYISYTGGHSFSHVSQQQISTIYGQETAYLIAQEHP